jgi:hypothetical protein
MSIDPDVEPFFNITFIFGSFVFCERCKREAEYTSDHPKYSDENYYDQAVAMKNAGWKVTSDVEAYCPECSMSEGSRCDAVQ